MSKIKIYELAKELGVSSKEVMEFLSKKNVEVKSHMSSVEETDAVQVRSAFSKSEKNTAEKEPAEKQAEAPKKKNIVHVFRPQNTQNGGRQGGKRPFGKPAHSQGRPMQVNNGRPAKGTVLQKSEAVKPEKVKPETVKRCIIRC